MIVSTQDIVEIRKGQNSDGFDRYPYAEVEKQSFSILVEGEMQGSDIAIPCSHTTGNTFC